jgi:ATP-dependent exoDNAse (exonuclease V) beta subunit
VSTGDEYDVMGTCIHNIFAIYSPNAARQEMINKAQQTVKAFGMDRMLPDAEGIIDSIAALYQYLEKQYGKAVKVEHEVPFLHESKGQVFTGEMDLLWYTAENECVLVDFKNYPGTMSNALDKKNEKYVGKYAVQLKAYQEALVAAGTTVTEMLIYYSVLGYLVEMSL